MRITILQLLRFTSLLLTWNQCSNKAFLYHFISTFVVFYALQGWPKVSRIFWCHFGCGVNVSKLGQLSVHSKAVQLCITKHIYQQNCTIFNSKSLSEINIHSWGRRRVYSGTTVGYCQRGSVTWANSYENRLMWNSQDTYKGKAVSLSLYLYTPWWHTERAEISSTHSLPRRQTEMRG